VSYGFLWVTSQKSLAAGAHQQVLNSFSSFSASSYPCGMGKQGWQNTGPLIAFPANIKYPIQLAYF
jgi:hypothetical protein